MATTTSKTTPARSPPTVPGAQHARAALADLPGGKGEHFFDTTLLEKGSASGFERAVRYIALILAVIPLLLLTILAATAYQMTAGSDDATVVGNQPSLNMVVAWAALLVLYMFAHLTVAMHFSLGNVMWLTLFNVVVLVLLVVHLYLYSGSAQVEGFQTLVAAGGFLLLMLPLMLTSPTTSLTSVYNVFAASMVIPLLVLVVYVAAMHLVFLNSSTFATGTTNVSTTTVEL